MRATSFIEWHKDLHQVFIGRENRGGTAGKVISVGLRETEILSAILV